MSDPDSGAVSSPQRAFHAALAAFQASMPHVGKSLTATVKTKSGSDYKYAYADLTRITEAVLPLLAAQGLTWMAVPCVSAGGFAMEVRLTHSGGHSVTGLYPLPDPSRSSPQDVGSAITYARRYALCAMVGLAPGGDDDDAARATASHQDAAALRAAVTKAAASAGVSTGDIPADYERRYGADIRSASPDALRDYVKRLGVPRD